METIVVIGSGRLAVRHSDSALDDEDIWIEITEKVTRGGYMADGKRVVVRTWKWTAQAVLFKAVEAFRMMADVFKGPRSTMANDAANELESQLEADWQTNK